jgi:hypothetical protein
MLWGCSLKFRPEKSIYIYMVGPELAIDLEDTLLKYMHNIKQ